MLEKKLSQIKLLLLDVDGILTDCRVFMDSSGQWRRLFSIRDGYGIRMLIEAGYQVGFITASKAQDIEERAKVLEIHYFSHGSLDKLPAFEKILAEAGLKEQEVAYMGDDLFDLPVLKRVGFSATVSDAIDSVVRAVDYIATRPAGNGAVREVCDLILKYGALSKNVV
ncbi:MAG: HAD hydrolase family protein [Bdellovibrionaceae bacterium]|nr:HAD hydrolase family protein [Pseudobdellovibrionaceae bacterium]MDW8189691.1 HAD hydrolase family protein [Pseudobdellovibrionaceae bacterium]